MREKSGRAPDRACFASPARSAYSARCSAASRPTLPHGLSAWRVVPSRDNLIRSVLSHVVRRCDINNAPANKCHAKPGMPCRPFIERLRANSSFASFAHDPWYLIGAVAASACNRPELCSAIIHYSLEQTLSTEQRDLQIAKAREALLKSLPLTGAPRVINALKHFKESLPADARSMEFARAQDTVTGSALRARGETQFAQTYGKVARKVQSSLRHSYPDLELVIIQYVYGAVLSFDRVLDNRESSLVIISALVPQDVNPQLKGHLYAALNFGVPLSEVQCARKLAIMVSEECGVRWTQPVVDIQERK